MKPGVSRADDGARDLLKPAPEVLLRLDGDDAHPAHVDAVQQEQLVVERLGTIEPTSTSTLPMTSRAILPRLTSPPAPIGLVRFLSSAGVQMKGVCVESVLSSSHGFQIQAA